MPDWFNKNVSDTSLRELARTAAINGLLRRDEMLDLIDDVTPVNVLGKQNHDSLKAIVGNATFLVGLDSVQFLSGYVVNGNYSIPGTFTTAHNTPASCI